MKSLVWLTETVLLESGTRCGADPLPDINTVRSRTEKEGESFLTITLPAFAAAIDNAIAAGRLEPKSVSMFHWHRRGLPEFLRGFLLQIFSKDGYLLSIPSVEAIDCVRQSCLLQKKIQRECTNARTKKALQAYRECESEVPLAFADDSSLEHFISVARIVWSDILNDVPFGDVFGLPDCQPVHGPGATGERIHGNAKYLFRTWHNRLEHVFPFTEFGIGSLRHVNATDTGEFDSVVNFVEPEDEKPVRVIFVPKTQKTPRVIAIEPVCMQYAQQGILRALVPRIEAGKYTGGRVNFRDQTINGRLALSSSKDMSLATLDLSEASDRVSSDLVWRMLEGVPVFRDQVFACRSTKAELPDGDIVTLRKFASMGSALCFPMEAMVFYCIIVAKRIQRAKVAVSAASVGYHSKQLFIYGDDIIVPTGEAPLVSVALQEFFLKVNNNKSFWTGKFRESCGVDAYDGQDVTPVYVRHEQPADRQSCDSLASWTAMANLLYEKGFWSTAKMVRQTVENILGPLPFGTEASQGFHWTSYSKACTWKRYSKDLMRFENRTWVLKERRRTDPLDGDGALLKCFRTIGAKALIAMDHLTHSVARGGHTLSRRWVPSI